MSIMSHVEPRINRRTVRTTLRRIRLEQSAARIAERRYDGGLPAEQSSAQRIRSTRRAAAKKQRRQIMLSRVGRRIHLADILRECQPDGTPRWAVVDPCRSLGTAEGKYDTAGTLFIGGSWRRIFSAEDKTRPRRAFQPVGLPALPQVVRDLAVDPAIRRRAAWVGVLYQPEEWILVNPDPALVVEWKDLPGEYYAIAVWGVDMPRIMEFVD